ncbi:MAG: molybdenum cofactor biosynthesis protein [Acidobacteria bacterium]|nr:MAG: molybdenum cofactor biosynthesis protein [Acidobacteriota bacterium]
MGHREHRRKGPAFVPCAVLTVSDTRDTSTDRSGGYIRRALDRAGHPVVEYRIIPDEPPRITARLRALARAGRARVVLLTGGTGIAPRDRTFEAVSGLLEKRLDGFGEIFRALSYRRVGPAAMLSRAVAGTYRGLVVFSMPGSIDAVRLAMRRLILPEMGHAAGLVAPRDRRERHDRRG